MMRMQGVNSSSSALDEKVLVILSSSVRISLRSLCLVRSRVVCSELHSATP